MGRTGTFSICEHYGMQPDIITLAKSLGSGIPVGAVLASDAVSDMVAYGDHGSTFGGGMMAMAAVEATLETMETEHLMDRAAQIFQSLAQAVAPSAVSVRGRGCLVGVELDQPASAVLAKLRESGVLAGASADPHVIRVMPPLTATDAEVEFFVNALAGAVA